MNFLVWRLHRNQVYWATGALAALAVLLLITGVAMANDYHSFLASCGATGICDQAGSILFRGDGAIIDVVNATLIVPLLFGLFWAAPLVAKEYEDGTQNLAWTQGVTRRQWLSANVLWVFLAAVLWAGALTVLVSWWRTPENAFDSRWSNAFDIQGIVPVAYAIFAVALGLAVGSIFRRVLPAIATTLGVFVVIRLVLLTYVRPHFMAPVTKLFPFALSSMGTPPGSWILSSGLVGPHGQNYGEGISPSAFPQACQSLAFDGKGAALMNCLASHGFRQMTTYQPASRFWAFQGIESAIFVVLAAALVALAYRIVLRRDA
jgi:ABC-type transport system involved in multi-copper enzyme maturation permease subunit